MSIWALLIFGCYDIEHDTDGDGLLDHEEEALGTDPASADTDGDGLPDPDELERGLDPLASDTDGDGWSDGDEVAEGTPATNPYIRPYPEGGYRLGTATMPLADCTGPTGEVEYAHDDWGPSVYQEGDTACNFTLIDAFGQTVDLYAFQGRFVLLNFCAAWCPPCQDVAADFAELEAQYAGDLTFVEVMYENERGQPPTQADLTAWHDQFGFEQVPVLGDPDQDVIVDYEQDGYIPTLTLLDREMQVVASDDYDLWNGDWAKLDALID